MGKKKNPPSWGMFSFFVNLVRLVVTLIHIYE